MSPVKVISQQPPGGRCTLYTRYAGAISEILGWNHQIIHSECSGSHGEGFPSLWIGEAALKPADGVILSPEDICDHLVSMGVEGTSVDALGARLGTIFDDFVESWGV